MARCGCDVSCSCLVVEGDGITVTGTGSPLDPFVVSAAEDTGDVNSVNGFHDVVTVELIEDPPGSFFGTLETTGTL